MIEFSCTSCKTRLQISDDKAGMAVMCSRCSTQLIVPAGGNDERAGVAGPQARSEPPGETDKPEKRSSAGAKDGRGPGKGTAALDSVKRLDSQLEQASKALIDALAITEKDETAAIFLRANYLGGRTKRGLSFEFLKGTAALILTVVFSWLYILVVLWLLGSAWQFLPLRKTEFLSITLRRRARFSAVIPFAIAYFVRLTMGSIIIGVVWTLASCFSGVAAGVIKDPTPLAILGIASLVAGLLAFLWYLYCNYTLAKMFRSIDEEGILEYQATLAYGYPRKVTLIKGISSAGLEKQLAGLIALCDTLSKTEFSPWEQVTVHNARQGFVSRTLGGLKALVAGD
jgi:hypothetical protein